MSIKVENLTHIYDEGLPFAHKALDDVSFEINDGDFVGLIGHTGSGKSTLIQHLNGIMKPNYGKIFINDFDITGKNQNLTEIRKRVGIVFQYAEYQLFEETVERDIAFGPTNLGLDEEEISKRVKKSMKDVGLDYETYAQKSPFDLSGGQKRRVAIAGVIAMNPEVLILDEPTAGLDPGGRDEIFELIKSLHDNNNMTVILSSHSMDDMAKLVNTLMVMNKGKLEFFGEPRQIFKDNADKLKDMGLDIPQVLELALKLRKKAGFNIRTDVINISEVKKEIERCLREKDYIEIKLDNKIETNGFFHTREGV
ncbi:energy-coupling factor transporter ATPase [Peptostreptococcus canis]|uniref:Energy-coupling factor transporter ATP-binding protein EcfA2 n=1 Tax=Peptostreptococcus canis TaxID=1159213 RepID=A0ABR6TLZ1_9FIRM|nr:energy-coupling factor transporter ATPase [Peptostreptococcus canis]MBC2576417.1 energy-coupling factor transporter ATPase [Peptostreptococcus canis]MBP1998392.1 energy-coupling factor transport system ATP-binding protein [Peptostreptococcus canis]